MCGLWRVRRQWHLHRALYRYLSSQDDDANQGGRPAARTEDAILTHDQNVQQRILTATSVDQVFTIAELRKKIKKLRHAAFQTEG
eukprot:5100912-Pyramimonas_sp.AAC.1